MNASNPFSTPHAKLSVAQQLTLMFQQGLDLHQQGRLSEARSLYEAVLKKQPKHFDALHMLGVLCFQSGQLDRAATLIKKAIALVPDFAQAHNNLGNVLQDQRLFDAALVSYNKALALDPGFAEAHNNRGDLLQVLGRWDAALASYDRAIELDSSNAIALYNRGNALKAIARYDDAIASYDRAIELVSDYADAWHNRGHALAELRKFEQAVQSYDRALAYRDDIPELAGTRLNLKMHMCQWRDFDRELALLLDQVDAGKKVCPPFPFLALCDDGARQRKLAERWVQDRFPKKSPASPIPKRGKHEKIRLGYFSADYWNHPVAYLIAGVFDHHDRSRFEVHAFSSGPDTQDAMRKRLEQSFDHFHDVREKSAKDVVALARKLEIDIAIDLSGLTKGCRPDLFAARVAPIQINYLGYPGTMGADFIDYVIGDPILIPTEINQAKNGSPETQLPDSLSFYSEKIIFLPHSYQANDNKRPIANRTFNRAELNLPESGFVFCCFNSNYKILPATFDSWMTILKAVPDSVLWLLQGSDQTQSNLRHEALSRGVDPSRLVFAQNMPVELHLARQRAADLFLDTLPYNAHTTASDALWAGLPVLTIAGQSFASRVAASLLHAIDLPELVTTSASSFEALAIELAGNPEKLRAIRDKLAQNRLSSPLFNTGLFTHHLESAFESIHARRLAGQTVDHLRVNP